MTLSTLDTKYSRKLFLQGSLRYLAVSLVLILFGMIYEHFSHEVYSPWMVGLCAVPLLTGALPAMAIACLKVNVSWSASQLWACAVLTLTLGCCFAGVLEIYGTTSPWLPWFFVLSGALMVCSVLSQYLGRRCAA